MTIKLTSTTTELEGILSLQKKNLKENLHSDEVVKEGFVTVHHDLKTLELMQSYEPQIIAVEDGEVIGYALVMVSQVKNQIPVLKPMFEMLETITYRDQKIANARFYIMGQVCIDKAHRGTRLFGQLYDKHKSEFGGKYDYCITEVSSNNKRSMRAHEKVGFKNIHSFSDDTDTWNILLLELNQNKAV